jgi:predicted phosphodiesterase
MSKNIKTYIKSKKHLLEKMTLDSASNTIAQKCSVDYNTARSEYIKYTRLKKDFVKVDKTEKETVLVIGDIHEPFSLDGYLEFCKDQYKLNKCTKVVFIGDIIDNHASSYHQTEVDADNAIVEFKKAKNRIAKWYKAFPEAVVIMGNHDTIPTLRKAKSSVIAPQFFKDFSTALETPNWDFVVNIEIDGVFYTHGLQQKAVSRAKNKLQSVVQGHYHTEAYCQQMITPLGYTIFAVQTGCGVDKDAYSMRFIKDCKDMKISCAVVYGGEHARIIAM